jgi:hypothetical protein
MMSAQLTFEIFKFHSLGQISRFNPMALDDALRFVSLELGGQHTVIAEAWVLPFFHKQLANESHGNCVLKEWND